MAKVTYEFDLYEDSEELELHQRAHTYYSALDEIYNMCRRHIKYDEVCGEEDLEKMINEIYEYAAIIHKTD